MRYEEAAGSLLNLTQGTRFDIAFAVNDVSRFNANHGKAYWTAVKGIFRYLRGTTTNKLKYSTSGNSEIVGFSNADWASEIGKRRSCTEYVFKLKNREISWNSNPVLRQNIWRYHQPLKEPYG